MLSIQPKPSKNGEERNLVQEQLEKERDKIQLQQDKEETKKLLKVY